MDFGILLRITAIMFLSQKLVDSYRIQFSVKSYHKISSVEERYYFACVCNGETKGVQLEKENMTKIYQSVIRRDFCKEDELYYCRWLSECQICVGYMNNCTAVPRYGRGYNCTRRSLLVQNHYSKRKVRNGRRPRQLSACFHPPLQTSDLFFVEYPNSISVKQKCIFGYTLDEGITRKMKCYFAKNEWKPTGFEECRPFIDCSIDLISSGHLACFTATPEIAPQCNVTCDRYEDKSAEPKRTYECQIDGGWKPKLPFCVTNRAVIDLVPAPKIRSHTGIKQTPEQKSSPKKEEQKHSLRKQEQKHSLRKLPHSHRMRPKHSSLKV